MIIRYQTVGRIQLVQFGLSPCVELLPLEDLHRGTYIYIHIYIYMCFRYSASFMANSPGVSFGIVVGFAAISILAGSLFWRLAVVEQNIGLGSGRSG